MFDTQMKKILIIIIIILIIIYFIGNIKENFTLSQTSNEAIQNISSLINSKNLKIDNIDVLDNINTKNLKTDNIDVLYKLRATSLETDNIDVSNNMRAKSITSQKFSGDLEGNKITSRDELEFVSPNKEISYSFRFNKWDDAKNDIPKNDKVTSYVNPKDLVLYIYDGWWKSYPSPSLIITSDGRLGGKMFDGAFNNGGMGKIDNTTDFKDCRTKCNTTYGGRLCGISRRKSDGECWCHDDGVNGTRADENWQAMRIL
jgi:flagellar biogenesis protein FliO